MERQNEMDTHTLRKQKEKQIHREREVHREKTDTHRENICREKKDTENRYTERDAEREKERKEQTHTH